MNAACYLKMMQLLELEAIQAEQNIAKEVKQRRYLRAFVEQIYAQKCRELSMRVENQYQQQAAKDQDDGP